MKLSYKLILLTGVDTVIALTVFLTSAFLKFATPHAEAVVFAGIGAAIFISVSHMLGVYAAIVSHMTAKSELKLAAAALISTALVSVLFSALGIVGIIFTALSLSAASLLPRLIMKTSRFNSPDEILEGRERVAIYGAGEIGIQLAGALALSSRHKVAFFLDDDPDLGGRLLMGIPVFHPADVRSKLSAGNVSEVFLALPGITRTRRCEIVDSLQEFPIRLRTVPSLYEILHSNARVNDLHDIDPQDLLPRDEVAPHQALLTESVKGKVVLVTGAGGSIGSEICRQIAAIGPEQLIMLELCEHNLYQIDRELKIKHGDWPEGRLLALLGNVCDEAFVDYVFEEFSVATIYHAAAYKHVPLVEANPIEAIRNNTFGTRILARAAQAAHAEKMVLISTDKAVRPTNVMGATKRLGEQVLQSLAAETPKDAAGAQTCFSIVRFGNVLGSSGSVVPLFRKQILEGGPLTVTHPKVTRYIMTIPEAVQLVLQASSIAEHGGICVLNMGEPVEITHLARQMIRLAGLRVKDDQCPEGDIEIRYIGLRPGEKLYEELFLSEDFNDTVHPKIMQVREETLSKADLDKYFDELSIALDTRDMAKISAILTLTVSGYNPAKTG